VKLTLYLDDDLAEQYQAHCRPGQALEQILQIQLKRFASVAPKDRVVLILPPERVRLEEFTNRLPLASAEDLVRRVEALAGLSIGHIRFRWTPSQFRQLQAMAERWRMTPAQYAERIVRQIEEQFFDQNPRPGPAPAESILVEKLEKPDAGAA
jgi:hypothetical protein